MRGEAFRSLPVAVLALLGWIPLWTGSVGSAEDGTVQEREDLVRAYRSRRDAVDRSDPDALVDLGLWCRKNGLVREFRREVGSALEMEPLHEGALKALGYRRSRGTWLCEGDWHRLEGHVRVGGRWLRPHEYWSMRVREWSSALRRGGPAAERAERDLARLDDPAASRAISEEVGDRGRVDPAFLEALARLGDSSALSPLVFRFLGRDEEKSAEAEESLRRHRERIEVGEGLAVVVPEWLERPRGRKFRGAREESVRLRWVSLLAGARDAPGRTALLHLGLADPTSRIRSAAMEHLVGSESDDNAAQRREAR